MKCFLSPHNDDEILFGTFTLLKENPHVIIVLRSFKQEGYNPPVYYGEREKETYQALQVCQIESHEQWGFSDVAPDWQVIGKKIESIKDQYEHFFVPAHEEGGHEHHNQISNLAGIHIPLHKLTFYKTYTNRGRTTTGQKVDFEPWMINFKLAALSCYQSQIGAKETCDHFLYPQYEYYEA